MSLTRLCSCTSTLLSRILRLPFKFLVTREDEIEGNSSNSTSWARSQIKASHTTRRERRNGPDLEQHPSELTCDHKTEYILITHIRVVDVTTELTRIPVGFYAVVRIDDRMERTSSKPALVSEVEIGWDHEIVLPSCRSSNISFTVYASFELGPTLGEGEVLDEFETTVGELLDRQAQSEHVHFTSQRGREPDPSPISFEIKIEQRPHGQNEDTTTSNQSESEEARQLREFTDGGHHALSHYRKHREQQYLNDSIKYFENARDLCPLDHPNRSTVLFNLANAKLVCCRIHGALLDLDEAINLYRDVLCLRPLGHPDHPLTLLNLGIALGARFQKQHDEAAGVESISLLSQVLKIALPNSYVYHVVVIALGSTAQPKLFQPTELSHTIEDDLDNNSPVQRLDSTLGWMLHPDSREHILLDHLGILFCIRFYHPRHLDKVVSMVEDAVQFTPNDHPDKPLWLNNLGDLFDTRYERFKNVADLERSISLREDAVKFTLDGDPDKSLWLNNLGDAFYLRYESLGDNADLERSISLFGDAVRSTPDGDPDRSLWLDNLGHSLSVRYERLGDAVDLERSISLFQDALQCAPDGYPNKPSWLIYLGKLFSTRYERFTHTDDLGRSVSLKEDAVRMTPDEDPNKPAWLDSLGRSLLSRYEYLGDFNDLERSISVYENALQLTSDGHPDKLLRVNDLVNLCSNRYQRLGDIMDLEKMISLSKDAVHSIPDGHVNKPFWLNRLGNSILTRYERLGDVADLENSITLFEDAAQLAPDGHQVPALNNLSISLLTRYERFGNVGDLEKSISLREDAVRSTPAGHPDKLLQLNNLGRSLWARYEHFGDIIDLKRSISLYEDALRTAPDGHLDKPSWLNNLGRCLVARYRRFGDVVDLERSISSFTDAVERTSDWQVDKPIRISNLADSLSSRYECFGDLSDMEKSISLFENALQLTLDGDPEKFVRTNNLGESLLTRYERFRVITDLNRSISLFEDVARYIPNGHPKQPISLSNLGSSLLTRYGHLADISDLERSICLFEDALRFTPEGHPIRPGRLNNLGHSLWTRYKNSGDIGDLQKAISLFEEVTKLTPNSHLNRPSQLFSLASLLFLRFQLSGDLASSDLSRAALHSSQAARSQTGPSADRFQACELWVQCARTLQYDSHSILDAYTVAVDLLPGLAWMGLSLHDRYQQLLRAVDTVCDAAAAALDVHRPELAVEWLEQGRSVVWGQFSQLRTPVDHLRTTYPDLAARFERVSRELEHAAGSVRFREAVVDKPTTLSKVTGGILEKEANQHHGLALERERLLLEIRALPGFERFLLPKTIEQLSSLTHSGTVVFLNASKHRCDALVIMAGSKHVAHVSLSNTNHDEVVGMQRQLNRILGLQGRDMLRDGSDRGARVKGMTPDDVFRSVLLFLWKKVVKPILEILPISTSGPSLPRIFWCPTGPFSFLPIHAAGLYDTTRPGSKLSDFAVSSYIPTMSVLELPQEGNSDLGPRCIRLLAVPQPNTDGQVHLIGVRGEIATIKSLASSTPLVIFQEADGTVEDVLSKMAETDWVHFACHGTQDRANPYDSGLLLAHGKRLKLPDIARLSRSHGGLAFLSACHTATGDEQLSEEAIHIAAGMLLAGYKGVIATMWSIMDSDAPRVTEDVYKSLLSENTTPDSRRAAEALHVAIERLRNSDVSFLSWVPFIHVGL